MCAGPAVGRDSNGRREKRGLYLLITRLGNEVSKKKWDNSDFVIVATTHLAPGEIFH
jgi:hypothetical protein